MTVIKSTLPEVDIPSTPCGEYLISLLDEYLDDVCETNYHSGRSHTFRDVVDQSRIVASYLQRHGIQPEDRVAFYCSNDLEYLPSVLGVWRAGGAVTFIREEMLQNEDYRNHIGIPRFVFTDPECVPSLTEAGYTNLIVYGERADAVPYCTVLKDDGSEFHIPQLNVTEAVAVVTFSGGTTGLPKAVLLTHRCINLAIVYTMKFNLTLGLCNEMKERPVPFCPFPTNHGSGLIFRTSVLPCGSHSILVQSRDPGVLCDAIKKYQATTAIFLPVQLFSILNSPTVQKDDLRSLKDITIVGGFLLPSVQQTLKRELHLRGLLHRFAMSEAPNVFEATEVPSSFGRLLPYHEAKVVDLVTGESLGPNQLGELYVRGPQVMKGYHNNPKATEETIDKEGWLKTGDVVHYEEDGHFYYADRVKEIVRNKEGLISTQELETILGTHPQVKEVAVIGVPSAEEEEVPRAYVILKAGATVKNEELVKYLADRTDRHKALKGGLAVVQDFARTVLGKPLKRALLEQYLNSTSK